MGCRPSLAPDTSHPHTAYEIAYKAPYETPYQSNGTVRQTEQGFVRNPVSDSVRTLHGAPTSGAVIQDGKCGASPRR